MLKRTSLTSGVVVAGLVLALAAPAAAQDFPAERYRAAIDAGGILSVESGALPPPFDFNVGLLLGWAHRPMVVYRAADGERLGALVDDRVGMSIVAGVALHKRVEVGLEVPVILFQDRASVQPGVTSAPLPALQSIGFGDLRLVPKFGLLRRADGFPVDVALLASVTAPSAGGRDFLGESSLSVVPELAVSRAFGGLRVAGNFGVPLRKTSQLLNQTAGSELSAGLGAAYRFTDASKPPLELGATLTGAVSATDPFVNANQNHLEARANVGWYFTETLVASLGGGVGLASGWGTPDWRLLAGVRWVERRSDRDGDGLVDSKDSCPDEPEDEDGFEDADGCIDRDDDQDGIPDTADGCRLEPEDKDAFEDENGCPDPDNDKDGVPDVADECPLDAEDEDGFEDANGCPEADNDLDGVPDTSDRCPLEPEDADEFEDADGCIDPDDDKDGVLDVADKCRTTPEDVDAFEDLDGCVDPDNDADGTPDAADGCRDVAGPVENKGCPDADKDADTVVDRLDNCPEEAGSPANAGCAAKQLVVIRANRIEILDAVYFQVDKDIIEKRSYGLLENVAKVIVAHPEIARVEVEGHTDNQGKPAYNLDLSQRRAASVMRFLVAKGVAEQRLAAKGYGDTKPIAPNATPKGRAKNRRVVFTIADAAASGIETRDSGPTNDTIEKGMP